MVLSKKAAERGLCSLLAMLALAMAAPAWAQGRASVSGYVRDVTSGETLLLANVRVEGTEIGAATNNSGYYTIVGLAPGSYTLTASYIGYLVERLQVELGAGEQLRLDIELSPEDYELEEVTVTAQEREAYEARKVGVQQIQTQLIRSLPTVLQPDVFRSLQLLPGVKAASDYSTGLYIRGGGPDQTLILLDQTTIYNPTHFFGFFSTFNPDAIKDVRLYKGGFPAEYGGRLGSVVDIYNRDGNRRDFEAGLSLGLLSSRAIVEGPHKRGSYMLAVRRSTIEALLAVPSIRNAEGVPNAFYFIDANGKLNLDVSNRDFLSLSFYAGQDVLDIEITEGAEARIRYGNRTMSLNWTHLFTDRLFSNFTGTVSRYFSFPVVELSGTEIRSDNTVGDVSVKGDFEYIPNDRLAAKAGFWSGSLLFRLRNAFNERESLNQRTHSFYTSLYAQAEYRWMPRLSIQGGLRVNSFEEGGFFRISPRFSLEYEPVPSLRLQAAYGRYHQFLTLVTSELFSGFDTWLTTGQNVPPSYGDQVVAGVKSTVLPGLNLDVELYYRTMNSLFELDPFVPDPAGLDYVDLFRFGEGHASGIEMALQRPVGRLDGFLAYTLSRTGRRFPDVNRFEFYPPKYDRTHDLKAVTNFDLSRRWSLGVVWVYATGQAYTEPLAQYRLVDQPFGADWWDVLVTEYNNRRLPTYHRLDVGATLCGRFFGVADYELQLQVINAYGRRNTWFYFYDLASLIDRVEIPQIPIPLPNVAFTLRF